VMQSRASPDNFTRCPGDEGEIPGIDGIPCLVMALHSVSWRAQGNCKTEGGNLGEGVGGPLRRGPGIISAGGGVKDSDHDDHSADRSKQARWPKQPLPAAKSS
jgi:hypothetical protein